MERERERKNKSWRATGRETESGIDNKREQRTEYREIERERGARKVRQESQQKEPAREKGRGERERERERPTHTHTHTPTDTDSQTDRTDRTGQDRTGQDRTDRQTERSWRQHGERALSRRYSRKVLLVSR